MRKIELFKMIWQGWFAGITVIITPLSLIAAIFSSDAPNILWLSPIIVPIVAALQGVLVGAIVTFGLTISAACSKHKQNH